MTTCPSCVFSLGTSRDCLVHIWGWVNTYRYIFSGMNIHLPAILGFTRYQGFDPSPFEMFTRCFFCRVLAHSWGGGTSKCRVSFFLNQKVFERLKLGGSVVSGEAPGLWNATLS